MQVKPPIIRPGEHRSRIGIADNNNGKFTADLKEHWEKTCSVRYEAGASEFVAQWADIYWVDTWDNNIHYLYKLYHGLHDDMPKDWDNKKKPLIVVRALDWEVWIGLARAQEMIDWVDKIITIAPHIERQMRQDKDNATGVTLNFGDKLKTIRPGVNLKKFKIKTTETDGFQIGMVLGDMWKYKNHSGGLDIFTTLYQRDKRWRLHVRGQHENGTYDPINWDHYLESRGIKDAVILDGPVSYMDSWYENIDYLLHPGQKEAFCYAVAEAAAKGIKPIVNNFYGSKDIWPSEWMYNTHEEAIKKFYHPGNHVKPKDLYRQYIEEHYSLDRMLKEINEYVGVT